jgi:hypothetical protein
MSNSLASAKRRRANMQPETTSTPTPSPAPSQPQSKMTIPAYLSLLESRLLQLEKRVDGSDGTTLMVEMDTLDGTKNTMKITDYMEDMDKRFHMLAEEITSMKDIVLSLQRYTLEVNQNLLNQMTSSNPELSTMQPPVIEEEVTQMNTVPEPKMSPELEQLIGNNEEIANEVDEKK